MTTNQEKNALYDRVKHKLRKMRPDFVAADLDEIRVLHSYCKDMFPKRYNDLLASFKYTNVTRDKEEFLQRLSTILTTEESIPESLKVQEPEAIDDTKLIPTFTLNEGDRQKITELCATMRKIIFATQEFDEPHRLRLLNRIAAIEAEINKPKGMFDVVRGGLNDLGETLGKFGTDIKPLTDRMREVVGIARKNTTEYDQLPAPEEIKKLPAPSEVEGDENE